MPLAGSRVCNVAAHAAAVAACPHGLNGVNTPLGGPGGSGGTVAVAGSPVKLDSRGSAADALSAPPSTTAVVLAPSFDAKPAVFAGGTCGLRRPPPPRRSAAGFYTPP